MCPHVYFIYLEIFLEYSIIDLQRCEFQVYSKMSQVHIYLLFFKVSFSSGPLQSTEWSSLCYSVGPQ